MGTVYRWEEYHSKTREEEADAIRETMESLTETTGVRPVGWFTRYGPSVNTRELVVAEGGFIYDSGVFNDDLPYYTEVGGSRGRCCRTVSRPTMPGSGEAG